MAEPMPAATGGGWLAEVAATTGERATVRCHRWVPGPPATGLAPNPAMAADVGRSLAAIHALGLVAPATTGTGLAGLSLADWHQTVTQAHRAGLAWAGQLAALTPVIEQLAQRLHALQGQGRPMVLSHRDLDPKNAVVRPDRRVALLDWDYAGPTLTASELLVTALSFAGGALQPDAGCVRACVRGFVDAGGTLEPPDLLDTAVIHRESLGWLWLNVDRCLGRRLRAPAAQRLAPSSSALPLHRRSHISACAICSRAPGERDHDHKQARVSHRRPRVGAAGLGRLAASHPGCPCSG
jgi:hypothetical protein